MPEALDGSALREIVLGHDEQMGLCKTLEHGGYHLMLMQPEKTLVAGDRVALELRFDDGSKVSIEAPVRRMGHMGH